MKVWKVSLQTKSTYFWIRVAVLFGAGFAGILSAIPMIPKLIAATGEEPPLPMFLIQAVSVVQSSVILFAMVMLGAWLAPKIHLGTPVLDALLLRTSNNLDTGRLLRSSIAGGIVGGLLLVIVSEAWLPRLSPEFIANSLDFNPPFYTKILYGGTTEEILIRWGLMTFLAWGFLRITKATDAKPATGNYVLAILISAILFGVGHLPAAQLLSPIVTTELLAYIIVGNALFGIIAGYLYWKHGLESAVLAHMLAHGVLSAGVIFASYV